MRRWLVLAVWGLGTAGAFSQSSGLGPEPPNNAVQRSRIETERSREQARFDQDEAACHVRFAVNDCIRAVRVRRREVLDALRQRELTLNAAEREQRALESKNRIREKSSLQRQQDEAERRRRARDRRQARELKASQRVTSVESTSSERKKAPTTIGPGRTEAEIADAQMRYQNKLRQAQAHQASVKKSRLERGGARSAPLPPTP